MENFLISLGCVTPMFITICVGLILRFSKVVPPEAFRHLSAITFHALLPCIVFNNIYTADLSIAVQPRLLVFLIGFLFVWFTLNYTFLRKRIPDHRRCGTFIQVAYRSNVGIVGLSLAQNMMGADGLATAAIAVSLIVPFYNVMAVYTLETCRGETPKLGHTIIQVIRNPMIIACILGFAVQLAGIRLPAPVVRAVGNLATSGSVTALMALGGSFVFSTLKGNLRLILIGCVYRLILAPLAAIAAAVAFGFRGDFLGIVLICNAAPLSTATYSMAIAYDSDHELTSQLIVCSSLLCSLTLFLWIFALRQLGLML